MAASTVRPVIFHGEPLQADALMVVSSPANASGEKSTPKNVCALDAPSQAALDAAVQARKKLLLVSALCMVFMVGEIVGGMYAHSLAILTDAVHLLSDLAGFLISIFAVWLANKPSTSRLSFGFHRAEIVGALLSVLLIWLVTGVLVYEAANRIVNPEDVDGRLMFILAAAGLGVNCLMGLVLAKSGHGHSHGLSGDSHGHGHSHGGGHGHAPKQQEHKHSHGGGHGHSHGEKAASPHAHGHAHADDHEQQQHKSESSKSSQQNINVRAALIHVFGDAIQSVGVMIAGALVWSHPDWRIADPICTFLFSILVLFTTIRLVKQSLRVLMEGVPEGIDPVVLEQKLRAVPDVFAIHDLHVWSLSMGKPSMSVHLLAHGDGKGVLEAVHRMLAAEFNIHHSTVQVEVGGDQIPCNPLSPANNTTPLLQH